MTLYDFRVCRYAAHTWRFNYNNLQTQFPCTFLQRAIFSKLVAHPNGMLYVVTWWHTVVVLLDVVTWWHSIVGGICCNLVALRSWWYMS